MELLQWVFLASPFALAAAVALMIVVIGGLVIGRPWVPLALYVVIFFVFAQSNYGTREVLVSAPVYSRGTGQLFFPALYWGLLVMLAWAWLGRAFAFEPTPPLPHVQRWLLAWLALLCCHVLAAGLSGHDVADALSSNGFIGIVWMAPLILLMTWSAAGRRPASMLLLARLLVVATLAKATFGLVRWAFLGGDSANIYANVERIDIRLTYFDVGDGLVCVLGAAVALSLLFVKPEQRRSQAWTWTYVLTVLFALVCIMLSYRRTAWGGLALVLLFFYLRMSPKWRTPVAIVSVPVVLLGLGVVMGQRLSWREGGSGIEKFFFDLVSSRSGAEGTRILELRLAWEALADSPIVGIGSWGRYASSQLIPWQDPASAGSFLHSGLLHIGMKAGLVGVLLLGGLLWAFVRQLRAVSPSSSAEDRALALAGAAGLLFMVPDFIFGTPIPQVRTMQLIALCFGLPAMVAAGQWARASTAAHSAHPRTSTIARGLSAGTP